MRAALLFAAPESRFASQPVRGRCGIWPSGQAVGAGAALVAGRAVSIADPCVLRFIFNKRIQGPENGSIARFDGHGRYQSRSEIGRRFPERRRRPKRRAAGRWTGSEKHRFRLLRRSSGARQIPLAMKTRAHGQVIERSGFGPHSGRVWVGLRLGLNAGRFAICRSRIRSK